MVGESMATSWTVVMVLPSSGTLTFRRLDSEPLRCQKGRDSGGKAVSLREVGERPMDRAVSLSEDRFVLEAEDDEAKVEAKVEAEDEVGVEEADGTGQS